jgi:glycerol-3-phosphate dehydrogenase
MNRKNALEQLQQPILWDVLIIGGGATGLGIAVDAASRGYKTLLVEQADFAKGTSSKATKLVHGGVRYLAQGNIKLVRDALKERALLLQNAGHVCSTQSFIIPCYNIFQKIKYAVGLKMYDFLSGKYSLGKTEILNASQTKKILQINDEKITGGIAYMDGQFDDARLAINLAQTATTLSATIINYCKVVNLKKENNKITGATIKEVFEEKTYTVNAKVIINATGIFVDDIIQMDKPEANNLVQPSQGIHLVIDKKYFNTAHALMIPKTEDGRVLFAVPWHEHVILGTTDTATKVLELEPTATKQEINFVLEHFNKYTNQKISENDVTAVFVGVRPLIKNTNAINTAGLSRDHFIRNHHNNLFTITGGKWTTYRKMANDILTQIIRANLLPYSNCVTQNLSIAGNTTNALNEFGTAQEEINIFAEENVAWQNKLLPELHYTYAHVVWAIRNEMAQTVEDVLARRTRILFLNAQKAIELAPTIANLIAIELQKDNAWVTNQISTFTTLVNNHYSIKKLKL